PPCFLSGKTLFGAVRHGFGEEAVYKAGDQVKLFVKGAKRDRVVYGTIVHFVAHQEVKADNFEGDGDIVFRKHPSSVFGLGEHTDSLRTLLHDQSRVDPQEWQAFEDIEVKKLPAAMVVLANGLDPNSNNRRPLPKDGLPPPPTPPPPPPPTPPPPPPPPPSRRPPRLCRPTW
ncbi:hypothetical protein VYU27_010658, partial [Nannochloropsis oceanica]